MRALVLLSLSACATLAAEIPGESIFVFDPAAREPALVQYAYSSGHFELVYEVYVYPDRTVCYFRSHNPRRLSPRFDAGSTELASTCSPSPDRCAFPGALGVRMAVLEALRERGDANDRIEVHIYTHPNEAASLDAAVALAEARALTLLPLLENEGLTPEQVDLFPHGWMGAAERVLHSDFEAEPCDDMALGEFATDDERAARDMEFDFATEESDPTLVAELRSRCAAAVERCRGTHCVDSFDGLGWVEILGDPASGQRSELAVTEPLDSRWVADIEARVAALADSDALGQSPDYGFHIPSISIAAGGHQVSVRAIPVPSAVGLLDSFFTRAVANGCRFDIPLDAAVELEDPRDVEFAPLGP